MICDLSDVPPQGCPAKQGAAKMKEGPGKLKMELTYDGYAKETAIMVVQDSTKEQLYYQPFRASNAVHKGTETHSFTHLGAEDYHVVVGDEGRDGFW
jgi:hypothetical protein